MDIADQEVQQYAADDWMNKFNVMYAVSKIAQILHPFPDLCIMRRRIEYIARYAVDNLHLVIVSKAAFIRRILQRVLCDTGMQQKDHLRGELFALQLKRLLHRPIIVQDHLLTV